MIKEFIYDKAIPTVSPLNELILNRVFKYGVPSMFLFRNPAQHKQSEKQLEAVAKRHKVCILPAPFLFIFKLKIHLERKILFYYMRQS